MIKVHRLVFSPIEVNTYIVAAPDGECAVIDCGCYDPQEFRVLTDFLKQEDLKPVVLLNTHCHLDHIFGNKLFFERYGLKPLYSEFDEQNRRLSTQHAAIYGLKMDVQPSAERYIEEGESIVIGATEFKAIHVPGHSAGTLNFYSREEGILFSGDALFAGSIGRTDLPGGNHPTLIKSITDKLLTLPEETIVYPGHGPSTTIGMEKRSNPFLS